MVDLVLNPRNRLVNFRVTDEEYQELRLACLACGSRGISDFARQAIVEYSRRLDRAASQPMEPQNSETATNLVSLHASLRRLIDELNTLANRFPTPETVEPPNKG